MTVIFDVFNPAAGARNQSLVLVPPLPIHAGCITIHASANQRSIISKLFSGECLSRDCGSGRNCEQGGYHAQEDYLRLYRACIHHISDYNPCQTQSEHGGVAGTPCRWPYNSNAFLSAPLPWVCEDPRATDLDSGCEMTLQKMRKCHRFGILFCILFVGCAARPSSTDTHHNITSPNCSEVRWLDGGFKLVCCTPDEKCYVWQ